MARHHHLVVSMVLLRVSVPEIILRRSTSFKRKVECISVGSQNEMDWTENLGVASYNPVRYTPIRASSTLVARPLECDQTLVEKKVEKTTEAHAISLHR